MKKAPNTRRPHKPPVRPLDSYLSGAIVALSVVILFLPLVVDYDFYYPYVFLKSILFRAAVEVMAMLYVVLAVLYPNYRPRINLLSGALVAYFGVTLIGSLPGVSLSAWSSWWGDFARMGGMFSRLHWLAYFYILVQVIKVERSWIRLFAASLFFNALMAFSGMIQVLGLSFVYRFNPGERLQGAAGNALWFGSLMVLNFFVIIWLLSRADKRETYEIAAKTWAFLLGGLDLLLIGLEIFGVGPKFNPQTSDEAYLALILAGAALHLTIIAWFFLRRSVIFGSSVLGILGCYFLYWLYQSQSRSAAVGLVATLAVLTAFYVVTGTGKKTRWIGAAVMLLVIAAPAILWMKRQSAWVQSRPALERLTRISTQTVLADRYWPWKASVLAVLDRPLLGWGLENYSSAFDLHFPPQVINTWESMPWFDRAHNIFLDVATTAGLLGLAVYLTFYALLFWNLVRRWFRTKDPTGSLAVAGMLLSYLIVGLATFDIINTNVVLYLVLAYAVWLHQEEHRPVPVEPAPHKSRSAITTGQWVCMGAAAAVFLLAFGSFVKAPLQSNLLLNKGIQAQKILDSGNATRLVYGKEVRDFFLKASGYETTGRYEVREEYANYAAQLAGATDAPLQERYQTAKQAVELQRESVRQDPQNARSYMYFASLVNRSMPVFQAVDGVKARPLAEESLKALETAARLSPTRPQVYFELGKAYGWLGRNEEEAAAIEKGMALNPPLTGARYSDAVIKEPNLDLLLAYIAGGKTEAAAKQWDKIKSLSVALNKRDYEDIVSVYASKRQLEPIVRLRQEQLQQTPDDVQLLAALATTYRDLGQMELARQTALKAAALAPQSGQTIPEFLDSLKK